MTIFELLLNQNSNKLVIDKGSDRNRFQNNLRKQRKASTSKWHIGKLFLEKLSKNKETDFLSSNMWPCDHI